MINFKKFINKAYSFISPLFTHPKKHLKTWLVILGVLVASWAVVFFLRSPEPTRASWWDETWLYRRAINLENPSSTVDNTQIKVFDGEDLSSLVSEGKLQASLDDLRFTDFNGNLLQYYIEDDTSSSTEVWILIPSLIGGDSTIFMYYGNASASGISDSAWMADIGGETNLFGDYRIHAFLDTGSHTYTNFHERNVDVLVVAGGGGGGGRHGAGGGAGGLLFEEHFLISNNGNISVNTGLGGDGGPLNVAGSNGENSSFGSLEAIGGGGGGAYSGVRTGADGGSGGGSTRSDGNGSGVTGQGNDGGLSATSSSPYNHGGGGGAGEEGYSGTSNSHGNGGDGLFYGDRFGESYGESGWFAGGGGGGGHDPTADNQGMGGNGGGGNGGVPGINNPGENGDNNTGGGGGGASTSSGGDSKGGDGGSGVVLVRYQSSVNTPTDIIIGSPSGNEEISPGPVAYWKFDEGEGTTAHDSSGQENDGTINGATWQTEDMCISGKCLYFDRPSSNYVSNTTGINIQNDFTYSVWVKSDDVSIAATRGILSNHHHPTPCYGTSLMMRSSRFRIAAGDGQDNRPALYFGPTLQSNEWYHVVVVYKNGTFYFYVNGNEAEETWTTTVAQNSTNFVIGRWAPSYGDYYFNGFIDEVKIYPYARTEEQIRSDYVAGASSKGSGAVFGHKAETAQITPIASKLVAHWKFNEGFGEDVHDSRGSNHGSFGVGGSAPTWTNEGKFGKALSFDGVDDYISTISPTGNLNPETGDFTISAWIYKPSDGKSAPGIISKNGNPGFKFNINGGNRLLLAIYDGSWHDFLSNTDVIEMDKWQHVAVAADRDSNANFFVNGESAGSQDISSMSSVNLSNSSSLRIGDDNWCRSYYCGQYDGKIDEVKIYNAALTQEEILQDYNQGVAAVMGQSSANTGSTAPGGSAAQEYCVPGSTDTCRPPVAEWDFEEGSGDTVYDKSGNGNDGAISGASWTTGKIGKGLKFTNSSDLVEVPNLPDNLDGFTVSVWARVIKTADWGYIFHRSASTSIGGSIIWIGVNNDNNYAASVNGRYTQGATNIEANKEQWRFISLTYDGSTQKIFIDGQLLVSDTFGSIGNSATDNLSGIGGTPHNTTYRPVEGDIDNIIVYDYARTPAQIAWDYNRGAPVGHWKFNECQGTIAHDSSGNENHGTINIGASAPQTTGGTCSAPTDGTGAWYNGREGKINSAMSFDGVDDWVNLTTTEIINPQTGSVSLWVKPGGGQASPAYVFAHPKTSDNSRVYIDFASGGLSVDCRLGNATTIGSQTLIDNTWNHVVCGWNSTSAFFYVNGIDKTTTPTFNGLTSTATTSYLGSFSPSTQVFNGLIDDVRIYNYALTDDQIKTLYNDGVAVRF